MGPSVGRDEADKLNKLQITLLKSVIGWTIEGSVHRATVTPGSAGCSVALLAQREFQNRPGGGQLLSCPEKGASNLTSQLLPADNARLSGRPTRERDKGRLSAPASDPSVCHPWFAIAIIKHPKELALFHCCSEQQRRLGEQERSSVITGWKMATSWQILACQTFVPPLQQYKFFVLIINW